MSLDPVALEVLNRKLAAITDEMYFSIQRASRSSFVKEAADFATMMLDTNFEVFAYPTVASFAFLVDTNFRTTIQAVPDLQPGDVIITNDPYTSGGMSTHLPDLHVIEPYFHDGRIVAYGYAFLHCADIGGSVPGSTSASLTSIHQEGLRIPPMKIVKAGQLNTDLVELLKVNTRMGELTLGDIRAMLGALSSGNKRLGELIAKVGVEQLQQAQAGLQEYTARKAREVLRRIPDGTYDFWEYVDNDAITGIPIKVRVRLTVKDGVLDMDLSGSDPLVRSAYNVPSLGMRNYWLTFRLTTILTSYDPSMAHNAGLYRDISVQVPKGSIFDAQYPDPVNVRSVPPRRLFDAVTGAVIKAIPELMSAPAGGIGVTLSFSEIGADGNSRVVEVIQPLRSGMGAFQGRDGVDARDNSMNNMRNHPIEVIEAVASLRVLDYDIRPNSGGAGRWRGGVGQVLRLEVLCEDGMFLAAGLDRVRFRPWGIGGGQPADGLRIIFNEGRPDERVVIRIHELVAKPGDTLTVLMPGGGGFGDPMLRDPQAVLRDVVEGFVTVDAAERDYGVVIVDGQIDLAATERSRAGRATNAEAFFNFGEQRERWEEVFGDEVMQEFNRRLYSLPKAARSDARVRIFEAAVPGISILDNRPITDLIPDPEAALARFWAALNDAIPAA